MLFNYGVLTAGFDAPRTRCVIIARPTTSLVLYSQMAGRAMRGPKAGGNLKAEIFTVADTNLPGFGSVTDAFTNWEESMVDQLAQLKNEDRSLYSPAISQYALFEIVDITTPLMPLRNSLTTL